MAERVTPKRGIPPTVTAEYDDKTGKLRGVRHTRPEDLEKFAFLLCVPYDGGELLLPDNATGACALCRHPIQFRPDGPRIMRLCTPCGMERAGSDTH